MKSLNILGIRNDETEQVQKDMLPKVNVINQFYNICC